MQDREDREELGKVARAAEEAHGRSLGWEPAPWERLCEDERERLRGAAVAVGEHVLRAAFDAADDLALVRAFYRRWPSMGTAEPDASRIRELVARVKAEAAASGTGTGFPHVDHERPGTIRPGVRNFAELQALARSVAPPAFDRAPRRGDVISDGGPVCARVLRVGKGWALLRGLGAGLHFEIPLPLPPSWRIIGERVGFVVRRFVPAKDGQPARVEYFAYGGSIDNPRACWVSVARCAFLIVRRPRKVPGQQIVARIRYLPGCSPRAQRRAQPKMAGSTGLEA